MGRRHNYKLSAVNQIKREILYNKIMETTKEIDISLYEQIYTLSMVKRELESRYKNNRVTGEKNEG